MKKDVQFYLMERELEGVSLGNTGAWGKLSEITSVNNYKHWFFSCLQEMGTIKLLSEGQKASSLRSLLGQPRAILVSVNCKPLGGIWEKVPFRILQLSLGQLMHGGCLRAKLLPRAQVQLVSTSFQAQRLTSFFGKRLPRMAVFTPRIDTDFYTLPGKDSRSHARKQEGIPDGWTHIVYAGRIIVTKGVCQLVRAMRLWPGKRIVITFAGEIDEDNKMFFSSATHDNFRLFLEKETLGNVPNVRFHRIRSREELRQVFWSADLFVNPSFQPDENFGITPREALACGVPVVTTNFGGLRPLADRLPWGIDTYPTVAGSCCSMAALRSRIDQACAHAKDISPAAYRKIVLDECGPLRNKRNLSRAIEHLLSLPPESCASAFLFERALKKHLLTAIDEKPYHYFSPKVVYSEGASVYGAMPAQYHDLFMQGLYSSQNSPPQVTAGTSWIGFFRVCLWHAEKAVVSFGFPGPRLRHYSAQEWRLLKGCAVRFNSGEYYFVPRSKEQVALVQNLVTMGYLVFFSYNFQ